MDRRWNPLAIGTSRRTNFRDSNARSTRAQAKPSSSTTGVEAEPPEKSQDKSRRGGWIGRKEAQIMIVSAIVIVLGTMNRFLYKAQLTGPMSEHVFFLAQLTTLGYVAIYFSILAYRYRIGIVTRSMLAIPKNKFLAIGALEAISLILGMIAAARVPGPLIPILTQTFLVWQVAMSVFILKKSFSLTQYFGAGLVAIGAAVSTANAGSLTSLEEPVMVLIWPSLLFLLSVGPPALASVIKESIFADGKRLIPADPQTGKGGGLDIFVVNSFGSLFQSLFVLAFLPLITSLKGIPFFGLSAYISEGFSLLQHNLSLPLLYVFVNISFNISILYLLSISSAVVASLSASICVPLTVFVFTLSFPHQVAGLLSSAGLFPSLSETLAMMQPAVLSSTFLQGFFLLMAGLVAWNWDKIKSLLGHPKAE